MDQSKRILVAVDDSEASSRAVTYVATMIGRRSGFRVRLVHVLPSVPPALLECGGSENPEQEERREAAEHAAQTRWLDQAENAARPVLARAKWILRKAGMPISGVETQLCTSTSGEEVVREILETARASRCGTVVVGRESLPGLKGLFQHHVGDELIKRGQGISVWVVE
ncbi:MAG: universal stress protein [candidate division NC10 bacterium]|nr:universal stress protein [candidate division NC10 bacterium]